MQQIDEGRLHQNQQLFMQYQDPDPGHKPRDLNQVEDISFWSETQKEFENTQIIGQLSQISISKVDNSNINEINKQIEITEDNEKVEVILSQQQSSQLKKEEDTPNYIAKQQLTSYSNFVNQSSIKNRQKGNSIRYGLNTNKLTNKNDSDIYASDDGIQKQINRKKQKSTQIKGSDSITSNIKLLMKIKQKILYFFKNYTYLGRTKFVNRQIRYLINDQSDIVLSENSFDKFVNNNDLLYSLCKYLQQINIPLINSQNKLGILISFFFIVYNCLFLLFYSLFVTFDGSFSSDNIYFPVTQFFWMLEIIVKFNTSIFVRGKLILNRRKLILIYIKNKFLFDLLPLVIIGINKTYEDWIILVSVVIFLKIVNVSSDLSQFQRYLCIKIKKYYIVQLINLMLMLFLIAHILACLWYFLALIEIHYLNQPTWIDDSIGADGIWWKIYLWALYWALTLMTTGSNTATTVLQTIFTSFIMLFTTIAFGYLLNVIGVILQEMDEKDEQKRKDINLINDYMRQKNISPQLQTKINLNLEYYYEMNINKIQEESSQVLDKVSLELKNSLFKEYNRNIINKITFLRKKFSSEILDELSLFAKEEYFLPNQAIFNEDYNSESSLMFIVSGSVEYVEKTSKEQQNLSNTVIKAGELFGQIAFFTGMKSSICVTSRGFTQILKIERQYMLDLIKDKEKDYEIFCQIKDQILMYSQFNEIDISCKICKTKTHQIMTCPQLHLDKDIIYTKVGFVKSKDQARQALNRQPTHRNRILIQLDQISLNEDLQHLIKMMNSSSTFQKTLIFQSDAEFSSDDDDEDEITNSVSVYKNLTDKQEEYTKYDSDLKSLVLNSESLPGLSSICVPRQDKKNNIIRNSVLILEEFDEKDSPNMFAKKRKMMTDSQNQQSNTRDFYKQLQIKTDLNRSQKGDQNDQYQSIIKQQQDILIKKIGSEVEFNSPYIQNSILKSPKINNSYKLPLARDIQEIDEKKQKYFVEKRRHGYYDNMKIQTPLYRKHSMNQFQQVRYQLNPRDVFEQFEQQYNQWSFEALKDFNYYFKFAHKIYNEEDKAQFKKVVKKTLINPKHNF